MKKVKSTKGCSVAVDDDDDLINDTIFEKKILNIKCVFSFCAQTLSKHFLV